MFPRGLQRLLSPLSDGALQNSSGVGLNVKIKKDNFDHTKNIRFCIFKKETGRRFSIIKLPNRKFYLLVFLISRYPASGMQNFMILDVKKICRVLLDQT